MGTSRKRPTTNRYGVIVPRARVATSRSSPPQPVGSASWGTLVVAPQSAPDQPPAVSDDAGQRGSSRRELVILGLAVGMALLGTLVFCVALWRKALG